MKFTPDECAAIQGLNLNFHWRETENEWFSDALENEMAIFKDTHDNSFVLRTRCWDDDDCEYRDDYEWFKTIGELVEYLK
jgi:hypothetical protein